MNIALLLLGTALIPKYAFPQTQQVTASHFYKSEEITTDITNWWANFNYPKKTNLINLSDNSYNGKLMVGMTTNLDPRGYDGGNYKYVKNMYRANYYDWNITLLTYVSETFAITYGIGAGAVSEKMYLSPSINLGFIHMFGIQAERHPVYGTDTLSYFSVSFSQTFGGNLSEKSCTDDLNRNYNCRTALSVVDSPLFYQQPYNKQYVMLRFTIRGDSL